MTMKSLIRHFPWTLCFSICCVATPSFATALPSYSCVFTEPFISLDISPAGVIYSDGERKEMVQPTSFKIEGPVTVINGKLADQTVFGIAISKEPGSDGMSDYVTPYKGLLETSAFDDNKLNGACLRHPDGSRSRLVVNVRENERLNVRSAPNVRGRIINRVRQGMSVWAHPEAAVGGWVRVSTALYPANETGEVRVVSGWVNARFLGGGLGQ
jgi:uncharacterized membrane protein